MQKNLDRVLIWDYVDNVIIFAVHCAVVTIETKGRGSIISECNILSVMLGQYSWEKDVFSNRKLKVRCTGFYKKC